MSVFQGCVPTLFCMQLLTTSRCYTTGDLVRQHHNGSFTFVGRKDSQIKLRGQLIEFGEIEGQITAALSSKSVAWTIAVEVIHPPGSSEALAVFYWPMTRSTIANTTSTEAIPDAPPQVRDHTDGQLDRRALRGLGSNLSIAQTTAFSATGCIAVAKVTPETEMF
ncbi:amino acid adenylation [Penicillium waksmanii]|uniref:amino acid adenylation n=1 Tax=Penicillium waksmanii TaxID=69791 RepID=UPI0025474E91|nr:amino acid adenylation [Penicillium waksmanii]KAJ5989637.1 amino acid adenylation [Penicillium waksmanii]